MVQHVSSVVDFPVDHQTTKGELLAMLNSPVNDLCQLLPHLLQFFGQAWALVTPRGW